MPTRHLLALALLGACTDPNIDTEGGAGASGGGGGKADDAISFSNLATQWELRVGTSGDAVVDEVVVASDGSALVTSSFPKWLRKVTPDGTVDRSWGDIWAGSSPYNPERTGYISVPAHEVFQVNDDRLIAAGVDGALFYLQGYLPNGAPDPAFGVNGRVSLPYWDQGTSLRAVYDADNHRVLVLVARAWESNGYSSEGKGPSKIEVLAYDEVTGAMTSVAMHDMPPWDTDGSNPAKVREVLLAADGAQLLLVSQTIDREDPARSSVGTQWSTVRLTAGSTPEITHLAVTSYRARLVGFAPLGGESFDLYLNGTVDGISVAYNEEKLVRISVDESGPAAPVVLGDGLDLQRGVFELRGSCPAALATPSSLAAPRTGASHCSSLRSRGPVTPSRSRPICRSAA